MKPEPFNGIIRRPRPEVQRLKAGLLRIMIGLAVTLLILVIVATWFWQRAVPNRTVIRNADMTPAREITSLLELESGEPYAVLAARTRAADYADYKWLKTVELDYAYPLTAVLTPVERKPVLKVNAAGTGYWLCDDGMLLRRAESDSGGVFDIISLLPEIKLELDPGECRPDWAAAALNTVACLQQVMAGTISSVRISPDGEFVLQESRGLPIHLGQPDHLAEKIGALPKALRLCEEHRSQLEYLDATNHQVFYENWKTVVE